MYNLWSTLCSVPELRDQMVNKHGELERGVRAMKTHRQGTVRGEVITVHGGCFMGDADTKKRMLAAGIVPEIVSAMRDEISGTEGELDTIGKQRLLSNSMQMLKNFGALGPQYRKQIVDAGGAEQIINTLNDFAANDDHTQHGFAELQHNLRTEACDVMAQLFDAQNGTFN